MLLLRLKKTYLSLQVKCVLFEGEFGYVVLEDKMLNIVCWVSVLLQSLPNTYVLFVLISCKRILDGFIIERQDFTCYLHRTGLDIP